MLILTESRDAPMPEAFDVIASHTGHPPSITEINILIFPTPYKRDRSLEAFPTWPHSFKTHIYADPGYRIAYESRTR
ncbi:hypothetical protein RJZ57_008485 [Blastomyces gilchristii]